MIPIADFLEQHYDDREVALLLELKGRLDRLAPEQRVEAGRMALRRLWPDEIEHLEHTHFIRTKSARVQRFRLNYAQQRFYKDVIRKCRSEKRPIRGICLKARQLGFCGHPNTRVLTADLRWVNLDSIRPGTEIVAVDEMPPGGVGRGRKMRTGVVEEKREVFEPAYRLRMSNGEVLVLTGEHRMLCRVRGSVNTVWRYVAGMRVGDEIRFITKPWEDPQLEDYWFGGILDGEGSFATHGSPSVNASQLRGPVWDRMESYLRDRGYNYCIESDSSLRKSKYGKAPVPKLVVGRMNEVFRLLGQTRPTKYVARRWWEGRDLPGKRTGEACATIVSIEALPVQRMIDLQTSTKTFIAEGFVSHNSTFIQSWQYEQCDRAGGRISLTISYDDDSSTELFGKAKFVHQKMWFPRQTVRESGRALEFRDNSSAFHVRTSGNRSAGRGDTYHHLHCSELPMWIDASETLNSAQNAVPTAPDTSIFHESTAKGAVGEFYDIWQASQRGENEFVPFFAPWFWDPDYTLVFGDDELKKRFADDLSPTEIRLQRTHKLTLEQLHWRRFQIRNNSNGSEAKFRQEYPSTPDEAFLTTGSPVFNADAISALAENVTNPLWIGNVTLEVLQ